MSDEYLNVTPETAQDIAASAQVAQAAETIAANVQAAQAEVQPQPAPQVNVAPQPQPAPQPQVTYQQPQQAAPRPQPQVTYQAPPAPPTPPTNKGYGMPCPPPKKNRGLWFKIVMVVFTAIITAALCFTAFSAWKISKSLEQIEENTESYYYEYDYPGYGYGDDYDYYYGDDYGKDDQFSIGDIEDFFYGLFGNEEEQTNPKNDKDNRQPKQEEKDDKFDLEDAFDFFSGLFDGDEESGAKSFR